MTGEPLFPSLGPDATDTPALTFPERALTHRELRDAAARVAVALTGRSRVAVLAEPRIETAVAVIGALAAGVPIVPLNPKSGPGELAHIVADANPEALLVAPGTSVPEAFAGRDVIEVELDGSRRGATAEAAPASARDPEAPALIVYTSGTTGPPKGAVLPRRAIASNLDALADAWAWTERDVVAHGLPLFHVHGLVIGILGPVRRGGTALHIGRFSPDGVHEALERGATMLFGVPTMYRRLADAAESSSALASALGAARLLVSGSAALPASEHERLERLTGRGVVERYGMTETLMNTAIRADGEPRPGSVDRRWPASSSGWSTTTAETLDVHDAETIGEIEVRGPNLFLGYLNRPDATAEAMHGDWFATGDMATRDARRPHPHRRPARHRPDQERRLQDRRGRDRGGAARAPRGRGRRGHRRARRRPRGARGRLGGPARGRRGRRARADRPRGLAARAPQAPAYGSLPGRAPAQRARQGPEEAPRRGLTGPGSAGA